jgi:hypothetical protein
MAGLKAPPPTEMSDLGLRGHLKFLHGAYTEPSLARSSLEACHRIRHRDPDPPYDIAHEHERGS